MPGLARIGLFLLGAALLAGYGTFLNLAPLEFGQVVGLYIATLFVMWQIITFVFFRTLPTVPIMLGGVADRDRRTDRLLLESSAMIVDEKLIAFRPSPGRCLGRGDPALFPPAHRGGAQARQGHAFDPVTEADKGGERAIRAIIERERPEDAILGEEYGEKPRHRNGWRWVLDPVDGTRAFITGRHEWGSLIALEKDEVPVLGILDQPVLGERFLGVNGRSVLIEGERRTPLKVRECASLKDAILCATDPPPYFSPEQQAAFARVKAQARMTRYRGDCYLFAVLAMGFVDIVIEAGFSRWDIAALIPLVEGAGGVITVWDGGDCRDGKTILACGDRRIHEEAIKLLKS